MKDKLRELAGRWKDEYAGIGGHEIGIAHAAKCSCATELLAILDAEGDGVAVDVVSRKSALEAITHVERHNGPGRANQARAMLDSAIHPARSGVVSDEDVDVVTLRDLMRDAERYRYVRDSGSEFVHYIGGGNHGLYEDDKLDQLVDDAIQGERHER